MKCELVSSCWIIIWGSKTARLTWSTRWFCHTQPSGQARLATVWKKTQTFKKKTLGRLLNEKSPAHFQPIRSTVGEPVGESVSYGCQSREERKKTTSFSLRKAFSAVLFSSFNYLIRPVCQGEWNRSIFFWFPVKCSLQIWTFFCLSKVITAV